MGGFSEDVGAGLWEGREVNVKRSTVYRAAEIACYVLAMAISLGSMVFGEWMMTHDQASIGFAFPTLIFVFVSCPVLVLGGLFRWLNRGSRNDK